MPPGPRNRFTSTEHPVRRVFIDVQEYVGTEAAGAAVLVFGTVIALLWANFFGESYESFWSTNFSPGVGDWTVSKDLRHWVNEGLMTIFFLVVALEIKRELVSGELKGARRAALPVVGVIGGMIVPALLYLVFNPSGPASSGWGIPIATDIAFAVGIVALVAPSIPQPAKVFLLSLAIVDDVGAILVIALVYSSGLQWGPILIAAVGLMAILALGSLDVRRPAFYGVLGILGFVVWLATLESGMHATIAGVAIAFVLPNQAGERLEDVLHPPTSFLIVPIFALANAGLDIDVSAITDAATSGVTLGVVMGLVVGKPLGISLAVGLAVKMGWGTLPQGTSRQDVLGLSFLAGIGFTVSLFITELAFSDEDLVQQSVIGIAVASILAAALGGFLLQRSGHGRGRIKQ